MTLLALITIVDDFSSKLVNSIGLRATSDGQGLWANTLGNFIIDNPTIAGLPAGNYARGYHTVYDGRYSRSEAILTLPSIINQIITIDGYLQPFSFFGTPVYQLFQIYFAYKDSRNYAYAEFESGSHFGQTSAGFNGFGYVLNGLDTGLRYSSHKSILTGGPWPIGAINPFHFSFDVNKELAAMPVAVASAMGNNFGFLDFINDSSTTSLTEKFVFLSKLTVQESNPVSKSYQHMWANNPDQRAGIYNANTNTSDRGGLWNNLRS